MGGRGSRGVTPRIAEGRRRACAAPLAVGKGGPLGGAGDLRGRNTRAAVTTPTHDMTNDHPSGTPESGPKKRRFPSAEKKSQIYLEAQSTDKPVGEILRREGLFSTDLARIRQQFGEGALLRLSATVARAGFRAVGRGPRARGGCGLRSARRVPGWKGRCPGPSGGLGR
jgi:hypothetical protein